MHSLHKCLFFSYFLKIHTSSFLACGTADRTFVITVDSQNDMSSVSASQRTQHQSSPWQPGCVTHAKHVMPYHTIYSETVFICVGISINTDTNKILCHNHIQQVLSSSVAHNFLCIFILNLLNFTLLSKAYLLILYQFQVNLLLCISEIHLPVSADTPSRFLDF